MESRSRRVEAARGDRLLDLIVEDVRLVNVYTREIYPADIGIYDGVIVSIDAEGISRRASKECFAARGKFAVPGLIDSHVHIESSMMSPAGFAAAVLPRGTTTIVTDPHEIGNVLGLRGVRYMLEATAHLPLRVYVQAPSCVPAVPGLETAGTVFGSEEITEMLSWDRVIGLAEVMDYVGVVQQSERMRHILAAATDHGTVISGHCPGLRGNELAAYMLGGPISDHEGKDPDELLEKLRVGMVVEGRVSSFSESMSILGKITQDLGTVPPNLVLCTDDIYPDDLLHHGHMDEVVRWGIRAGMLAADAVRAATLHAAQRHRLHDLGAIAPGKLADIILTNDLDSFQAEEVFVAGKHVASGGRLLQPLPLQDAEVERENTIHLARSFTPDDFILRAEPGRSSERLNVLVIKPDLSRDLEVIEFPVIHGLIDISAHKEVCLASILERHGLNGNQSLALVKGLGIQHGAAATTVAHDCHNLVVVGRDPLDMALAVSELAAIGGGICSVSGGKVSACLPLPIAGLMNPGTLEVVVPLLEQVNQALRDQGVAFNQPLTGLLSLALPVIPAYGLTDRGLVDVARQVVLTNRVEEA